MKMSKQYQIPRNIAKAEISDLIHPKNKAVTKALLNKKLTYVRGMLKRARASHMTCPSSHKAKKIKIYEAEIADIEKLLHEE